ncbi:hypothetical protein B0T19DRAFT_404269 [Cercophora scortea]|uniref:Uncharacterized protein n=1 Tax=Cercophora scortea TaxID=314031 RepID=A0AAE0I8L0_9PEZI|nr:hypothetical protein B0T19DRAFT_404269 [Cercophora scortea]
MKCQVSSLFLAFALASANPLPNNAIQAREVPQEHSHEFILKLVQKSLVLNNPKKIQDSVFGLLGNAAASAGAGLVTNPDCLQQETADQAFTNAKAAGDIPGMAGALMYRSIERNTGKVGLASVICPQKAVNPEIAALTQHQDPASANAASINKGIVLELAKQLAAVGADPLLALETGTFAPGSTSDNTGRGNACDTQNDDPGCIFSQNLLVLDATPEEIAAAVVGITPTITGTGVLKATHLAALAAVDNAATSAAAVVTSAAAAVTTAADATATASDCTPEVVIVTETAAAESDCTPNVVTVTEKAAAPAAAATTSCSLITTTIAVNAATTLVTAATPAQTAAAGSAANIQKFTGTLGGAPPPIASDGASKRPFTVKGNTFVNLGAAVQRSCDVQHNACANAANSGALAGGIAQCETQQAACVAANTGAGATKAKRAGALGKCSNPTIVFKAGLDGRNTNAFIAANQADFNHGSALNIAVIAGFICQRLGSPCNADATVQAACAKASAAAVATTQNQAAADAFNSIIGAAAGGAAAAAAPATTAAPAAVQTAAPAAASVVMTLTQCSVFFDANNEDHVVMFDFLRTVRLR